MECWSHKGALNASCVRGRPLDMTEDLGRELEGTTQHETTLTLHHMREHGMEMG